MQILCLENYDESTTKLLEIIDEFSKIAGYKPLYKNQLFLYNNYLKKIETVLFIIASKRIKCIAINLTKEIKDLYTEKKPLVKKLKKTQMNGIISHVSGLGDLFCCSVQNS